MPTTAFVMSKHPVASVKSVISSANGLPPPSPKAEVLRPDTSRFSTHSPHAVGGVGNVSNLAETVSDPNDWNRVP